MVKVEAIAVDIDGTITDEKRRLCHSSLDALRKAEDAGIPVIIVTGNTLIGSYESDTYKRRNGL